MKRMKIKRFFILVGSICCMILTGCNLSNINVSYDFTGAEIVAEKQENSIATMTDYIQAIEKCSNNNHIEELTIYVADDVMSMHQDGEVYINTQELDSLESFFKILLAISEVDSNAGEAYGLAVALYEDCGIGEVKDSYTDEELASFFTDEDHLYLLDFTLPMLEEYFFDEKTAAYVQDAAKSFVDYCIEEYGVAKAYRLCLDASDEGSAKLVQLKNDWLKKIGASVVYEEYGKMAFTYNYSKEIMEYPYVLREESANWYFSAADIKECGYITFVEEYKKTASVAEMDFLEAREVLKEYLQQDIQKVDIFTQFYNTGSAGAGATYYVEENVIRVYQNWGQLKYSLLHEYVHYLTHGEGKQIQVHSGLMEGVTDAIANLNCENHLRQMYYDEIMVDETYGEENRAIAKEVGAFSYDTNQLDERVYYYYLADYYYRLEPLAAEYKSISLGVVPKPSNMSFGALSYPEAGSMAQYLIEQYGLDMVLENCTEIIKIQEMTGKTFLELYEEWGKWNEQRYQELKIES